MSTALADSFLKLLQKWRLVAILRLDDLTHAQQIVQALLDADIRLIEFTMTNDKAASVVNELRQSIRDFESETAMIGLGSVRNPDEAKTAIDSGAQFIVSPITRLDTLKVCEQASIPTLPGSFTPTEMALAWDAGATAVKLFPARHLGPSYIRDCLAPMPYLRILPTGGIDLKNIHDYFRAGAIGVGMGSNLIDTHAIETENWNSLTTFAKQFAQAARNQPE